MSANKRCRYRIDLNYIGTDYNGWQAQTDKSAIQDFMEAALKTALREQVRLNGASRTDSGVHARHQVATFDADAGIDVALLRRSLTAILPLTIGVDKIQAVDDKFHAIRNANAKVYRYQIWNTDVRNAFVYPYVWRIFPPLDAAKLNDLAQVFVGTHDFSAFCSATSSAKTKERTILEIKVLRRGDMIEVWILGTGFLKQMVRSMVGTLIDVYSGKFPSLPAILATKDRTKAGQTAPAAGLCLYEIFYERVPTLDEIIAPLPF